MAAAAKVIASPPSFPAPVVENPGDWYREYPLLLLPPNGSQKSLVVMRAGPCVDQSVLETG